MYTNEMDRSPIQKFYSGSNIFVTGATGFMGKCLLEKLLRSCPDINLIYILVREKRGKSSETRLEELFQDVIFSKLKEQTDKYREKVVAISGDVSLPGLGLTMHDKDLLQNKIDIVFHVAATVRFDEKIKLAVTINLTGTREMLNLCKEMKHLKSLIHVSTAYCNCHLQKIEETFYKYPVNYEDLPMILEKLDDKAAEELTPRLLGDWPNTYTFTKAMAEALIRDQGSSLPMAIFRPGIVVSTWKEPLKGWIDNVYGPNGICAGALMGILGSLWCDENISANIVPVDMTINALLAVAWNTAMKFQMKNGIDKEYDLEVKNVMAVEQNNLQLDPMNGGNMYEDPPQPPVHGNDSDIRVYNYVSTIEKPLNWSEYCGINLIYGQKYPLSAAIWFLDFSCTKSVFLHSVYMVLFHLIPAIFVDAITLLLGKKPRLVKLYKQMDKFTKILSYFANNEWLFTNNNIQQLWQTLDVKDKKLFYFSMADMDWLEYFRNYTLGLRVYLYKDDESTLPAARRKQIRFLVASKCIKLALLYLSIYTFLCAIDKFMNCLFFFIKL